VLVPRMEGRAPIELQRVVDACGGGGGEVQGTVLCGWTVQWVISLQWSFF